MRRVRCIVWGRLKETHPWLYEAVEWAEVALSAGAFLLALLVYLRGG